jgi:hypothetical protein
VLVPGSDRRPSVLLRQAVALRRPPRAFTSLRRFGGPSTIAERLALSSGRPGAAVTAASMGQLVNQRGVIGSAHPPEFNTPVAQALGVDRRTLAQALRVSPRLSERGSH